MTSRSSTLTQIISSPANFQAESCQVPTKEFWRERIGRTPDALAASAYLHVPFCFHKCHYCDFYSIVDSQDRQAVFVDRLIEEIRATADFRLPRLQTIFIGGGTPTLLKPHLMARLLQAVRTHLSPAEGGEFTVECNPETMTAELAAILAEGGVNRVSIGCQSFNAAHLKTLERWHDPANVQRSVALLRSVGIDNINLDLIFAIPGQMPDDWQTDLEAALALNPSHLSCYGLVYEPNTPLTVKMRAGQITPCEQDLEAELYRATIERLARAGFEHYEISNWARPGFRCAHNMAYWTNQNWWPLGPGASGHVNGWRWKNVARLGEYLANDPWPPVVNLEHVNEDSRIGEEFMLGLRLIHGMPLDQVERLMSNSERSDSRRLAIERHLQSGLLESTGDRLRFSADGLLLADDVLADLV